MMTLTTAVWCSTVKIAEPQKQPRVLLVYVNAYKQAINGWKKVLTFSNYFKKCIYWSIFAFKRCACCDGGASLFPWLGSKLKLMLMLNWKVLENNNFWQPNLFDREVQQQHRNDHTDCWKTPEKLLVFRKTFIQGSQINFSLIPRW